MYFWLNYSDKNSHIEKIPDAVKNTDHFWIESDKLHLYSHSDGTRIDDNKYLENLQNYLSAQRKRLSIYFDIKRYLHFKNNSYPLNNDYFLWHLPFLEAATKRCS